MLRKIIEPTNTNLTINIPKEYVGKKIEYIIFPIEETIQQNISSLKGALAKYANKSKIKLENKAWQEKVKEKFLND